jgi:hypothetical protein
MVVTEVGLRAASLPSRRRCSSGHTDHRAARQPADDSHPESSSGTSGRTHSPPCARLPHGEGPRDARLMGVSEPVPNPLSNQDAEALIGILAILEGGLLAGELDGALARDLARRLRNVGLIPSGLGDRAGLRVALGNLNQRGRYTRGEYERLPPPDDGRVDHHVESTLTPRQPRS